MAETKHKPHTSIKQKPISNCSGIAQRKSPKTPGIQSSTKHITLIYFRALIKSPSNTTKPPHDEPATSRAVVKTTFATSVAPCRASSVLSAGANCVDCPKFSLNTMSSRFINELRPHLLPTTLKQNRNLGLVPPTDIVRGEG